MTSRMLNLVSAVTAATAMLAGHAWAGNNIDVSTIPVRDTVQLTIYNSEDLTLVRETRHITFHPGDNPLQFSWAGTLIDPTSVDLRFRTHGDELDVLDTTFPHDKPQMLYWNVRSRFDGDAIVEITYFTSGITWAADYVCIVGDAGGDMSFEGFVRITNNSGENYENANVRLVVGQINLVEKIADLARRGMVPVSTIAHYRKSGQVQKLDRDVRVMVMDSIAAGLEMAEAEPKAIIKEGLSEYFIYTIEGTETILHAWSKRMRLFQGQRVPFREQYRYRPQEYGDQLVRLYILRNDEASRLGSTPLPDGTIRLFRDTGGGDGLAFLVTHYTKYVPIGQEIEINLGRDPEVVHERIRLRSWRDEFWFHDNNGRKLFSPDRGPEVRQNYPVAGWDEHARWIERIRNDRRTPIDVQIRLAFDGHVLFQGDLDATLHDYRSPQFAARIEPGNTRDLGYTVTYKRGVNQKQNNVTIE